MRSDHIPPVPMSGPDLTDAEIAAVVDVLRSGRLSVGPKVAEFERALCERVGARHAVAVSSGTAAVHLSLVAVGVAAGDYVVTTPFSFVATAHGVLYERGVPIFVDVEPDTGNVDPAAVGRTIDALKSGRAEALPPLLRGRGRQGRLRAVLPVHVFGRPVDMPTLGEIARARGVAVVEDACEALGARWAGRHVGTFGDAGCFGFYPNKQITTAEGGAIVTDDERIAGLCRSLRNQGWNQDGPAAVSLLGYNYRLSDIACALGVVQLGRFEELQHKRARVRGWYEERLAGAAGLRRPDPAPRGAESSPFTYVVRFDTPELRTAAMKELAAAGIDSRIYFRVIPLEPLYTERFGYRPGDFPNAERLGQTCLALPFSSVMTEAFVERVSAVLGRLGG